jgi:hypothetical protein
MDMLGSLQQIYLNAGKIRKGLLVKALVRLGKQAPVPGTGAANSFIP